MRVNPLLTESLRGLARGGAMQTAWLNALALQALVLLLWWPKQPLADALQRGHAPDTLLAVLVTLGLTLAWHSMRAGAEELRLPGQQSLREWRLATPVGAARLTAGLVQGQVIYSIHAVLLALPLLLPAASVSGSGWRAGLLAVVALLVQALAVRLVAAWVYLRIGHLGTLTYLGLRVMFITVLVASALWLPPVSLPLTVHALLEPGAPVQPVLPFVLVWTAASALAGLAVWRALAGLRGVPGAAGG